MKVIRKVAIGLTVGSILLSVGSRSLASNEKKAPICEEDETLIEKNGIYECIPIDDIVSN